MQASQEVSVRKSSASLDELTETSKKINSATKRLTGAVEQLNEALKRLNLGVPVWTIVCTGEPSSQIFETEELGYAKVKGKWGVSIRFTLEGLEPGPEQKEWHFEDAPRDMRIRASKHFSRLLAALNEESLKTAAVMEERAHDVEEMSLSILEAAKNSVSRGMYPPRPREAK